MAYYRSRGSRRTTIKDEQYEIKVLENKHGDILNRWSGVNGRGVEPPIAVESVNHTTDNHGNRITITYVPAGSGTVGLFDCDFTTIKTSSIKPVRIVDAKELDMFVYSLLFDRTR